MVSTRRSRSAGGESEDAAAAGLGSQPEVASSRHTHAGGTAAATAASSLQPIAEEPAAAIPAAAAAAVPGHEQQQPLQEHSLQEQQLEQQPPQEQSQQQQQPPEQQQLSPENPPAQAKPQRRQQPRTPRAPRTAATVTPAAGGSSDSHDAGDHDDAGGGSDSEGGWNFDGPDMLQNLAASIRSAMSSRAGHTEQQQQQQQPNRQPARSAAGKGSSQKELDVERLRWQPHTGLQLPAKAVQVVAAAAQGAKQHGGDAVAAGPLVDAPADDSTAAVAAAAANAAAANGSGSLAKHSRAPTLDPMVAAKEARKAAPSTAGKQWYGLPAQKITDEMKRDLRLLRLRGAYDPKRFYKSFDETKFPKHFAIGTVVDDPLDFYGGRLSAGQRKASLTDQLLADRELEASRKKRYNKLQDEAQKWVKHKKRKTDQPRKTPSKHRPKH